MLVLSPGVNCVRPKD
uniref:Uncharacterized protein n=1 Tax=Arundo donax TaxID=35708 RepID=A0A0A9EPS4_ARUDO